MKWLVPRDNCKLAVDIAVAAQRGPDSSPAIDRLVNISPVVDLRNTKVIVTSPQ